MYKRQATQTFGLTITPAVIAPAITAQPANASVGQGENVTFSVTATGTAPLSYQWSRNGVAISGATGSTFVVNAQPGLAGTYSVGVSNTVGSATSNGADLVVNTPPVFTFQPTSQTVLAGSTLALGVGATGGASFNYQWRKNGVAIAGATGSTLTLTGVTAADAGNYDVYVSNALGLVGSSLAQITVTTTPVAPTIVVQPAGRTALIGTSSLLSVAATGAPTPGYQWRKNGVEIPNANGSTFSFSSVQATDAGVYDVVIRSNVGSVTSAPAVFRVIARSYGGFYFGNFSGGAGSFGLYVRDDNTGVFLGYIPGATAPVMSLDVLVEDSGGFTFSQVAIADSTGSTGAPPRAAALGAVTLVGAIGNEGVVAGSVFGGSNAALNGSRAIDTGATASVAGYYLAGATGSLATSYTIAGPNGQAFVVLRSGNASDGGIGSVTAGGAVSVVTNRSIISETIAPSTRILTGTSSGAISATLSGGSESAVAMQRLVNISTRARVGTGDAVAIAGFVISGEASKPVLIRAVGLTIGAAPFNIPGALAAPRLELFRGSTSLAVNSGIAGNRTAIDAAGTQAGAFPLGASGADAAILTTLPPGNYTAVVSSATNTAGIALVEVYDLSAAAPGQKLLNISTRAAAGTAEATLIAGFVVPPGTAKRVLVRGVGPGLAPFNVGGLLAQPMLLLLSGSTTIAQNTNWNTSADAAAITAASAQVGAFGLANNDSALIITLAPGNYTAQVLGVGGTSGNALIEVYELP